MARIICCAAQKSREIQNSGAAEATRFTIPLGGQISVYLPVAFQLQCRIYQQPNFKRRT